MLFLKLQTPSSKSDVEVDLKTHVIWNTDLKQPNGTLQMSSKAACETLRIISAQQQDFGDVPSGVQRGLEVMLCLTSPAD